MFKLKIQTCGVIGLERAVTVDTDASYKPSNL
jgi:hypothetical protein